MDGCVFQVYERDLLWKPHFDTDDERGELVLFDPTYVSHGQQHIQSKNKGWKVMRFGQLSWLYFSYLDEKILTFLCIYPNTLLAC